MGVFDNYKEIDGKVVDIELFKEPLFKSALVFAHEF